MLGKVHVAGDDEEFITLDAEQVERVGLTGFEDVFIGETINDAEDRPALPYIPIDPPTIQMQFAVNDSPLVDPVGVETMSPSARNVVRKWPSM